MLWIEKTTGHFLFVIRHAVVCQRSSRSYLLHLDRRNDDDEGDTSNRNIDYLLVGGCQMHIAAADSGW